MRVAMVCRLSQVKPSFNVIHISRGQDLLLND